MLQVVTQTLVVLAARGLVTSRHAYFAGIALPAGSLGLLLGVAVYDHLDSRLFGRIVVVGLLVSGLYYIADSALELLGDTQQLQRTPAEG